MLRRKPLSIEKPELLKEWDYEKNEMSPEVVTAGSSKLVWWICSTCGNKWQASIKNRVNGSGCRLCSIKRSHLAAKRTTEEFITELQIINPSIQVIGEYEGSSKPIQCKCSVCCYQWSPLPSNLLTGVGCPKCAKSRSALKRRKPNKQFCDELKKINPNIIPVEKYINEKTKIIFRCKICGNTWSQMPDALLRGEGCPSCNHTNTSFFEQLVFKSLQMVFPCDNVVSRDRKTIGLELDVYIPTEKVAIEYGAWIWHKRQIKRDEEKRQRCLENNIRLITIFDGCGFEKEEPEDVIYYSKSIGADFSLSKEVINKIFQKMGINYLFSEEEWATLRNYAYYSSRRKSTSVLKEELKTIAPTIEVLGEYKASHEYIKVKCTVCGHIWNSKPNYLLSGNGCPLCNNGQKTNEEFLDAVKALNPNIIVLDEYKGSLNKVHCKCGLCGFEWQPYATNLLHGYGCPACAKKRLLKDSETFKEQISILHPNIKILGEYAGALQPISCQCKKCGYKWDPLPSNLLAGRNCPNCALEKRRKSTIMFVEEINNISSDIEILGEYQNNHTPILCKCKKCGYQWEAYPKRLLQGAGCKRCNIRNRTREKCKPVINANCATDRTVLRSKTDAERSERTL